MDENSHVEIQIRVKFIKNDSKIRLKCKGFEIDSMNFEKVKMLVKLLYKSSDIS